MSLTSLWGRWKVNSQAGRRSLQAGKRARQRKLFLEALEPRILLTELVGRQYFDDLLGIGDFAKSYPFELSSETSVKIQLSRLGPTSDLALRLFENLAGEGDELVSFDLGGFGQDEHLPKTLPSGAYRANVAKVVSEIGASFNLVDTYRLAIVADTAPGELFSNSTDFRGDVGTSLHGGRTGQLLVTEPAIVRDFIGYFDTDAHLPTEPIRRDLIDTYFIRVPLFGTVTLTLDELVKDPAGGSVAVDLALFRDLDGDGRLEPGEVLDATSAGVGQVRSIQRQLNAGDYAVVVSRLQPGINIGGSNYRLQAHYAPLDNAGGQGNVLAGTRNIGVLGPDPQAFVDYVTGNCCPDLPGSDPTDAYRFSTVGDGPFVFNARFEPLDPNAEIQLFPSADVELIRDGNGNGVVDPGEVLARGEGLRPELNANLTASGTYFLRVLALTEGPYRLTMSSRNTDLAGSTLPLAGVLPGQISPFGFEGRVKVADHLSSTDTLDIYQFTTTHAGTVQASFPRTQIGTGRSNTNADLFLIQDLDGDLVIDANEILAASTNAGNSGESLSRFSAAGRYYVMVSRVEGNPYYELTVNFDSAGATAGTARVLIPGSDPVQRGAFEFIGPRDTTDLYLVNLAQARRLTVGVGSLDGQSSIALGRDGNGNGVLDSGEILLQFSVTNQAPVFQSISLSAGTYLIRAITPETLGTRYNVVVGTAPFDRAGDALATARNVTLSATTQSFNDFVGDGTVDFADDLDDFYRFSLTDGGPFQFVAQIGSVTGNVGLQLIRDDNLNGQIDEGEVLATTVSVPNPLNPPLPPGPIVFPILVPGTYYLRVFRIAGQANYTLGLSAPSFDTARNTLATAQDLGPLTTTLSAGGFVGRIDTSDVYKFSVAGPAEVLANFSGTVASAVAIEVIRDADNDFEIDPGETLASTADPLRADDVLGGVFLPAAGTYYVRVLGGGADSNYTVNLLFLDQFPFLGAPFQIDPKASTTIQAEDFDAGGQGDAYFDTTSGNAGGQYRPKEDVDIRAIIGGSFRVSDTAVDEFLEYTVNVPTTGLYDFEFRVATIASGATFHAEIDGVNVTGSLQVPNTGADQFFVFVSKLGVPIIAGPHILRLRMDSATSAGQAGNYDFIRITPAVGTFCLTPSETTVAPNQRTQLSVAWTVPFGGWRTLNEVELRLRDDAGTVLQVKFNEAENTLSLFNPATGKYGPAKKLGSHAVLSNRSAHVYVATSRVVADGPEAATVELVLDVSLKPSVRGRRFMVEAAASNDFGQAQPFSLAGFLSVSITFGKAPPGHASLHHAVRLGQPQAQQRNPRPVDDGEPHFSEPSSQLAALPATPTGNVQQDLHLRGGFDDFEFLDQDRQLAALEQILDELAQYRRRPDRP